MMVDTQEKLNVSNDKKQKIGEGFVLNKKIGSEYLYSKERNQLAVIFGMLTLEPGIAEQLLTIFKEIDTDGDGKLMLREVEKLA